MKKVAVIQDLSSLGKCSLTADIPVLSVMGVQACPLPTAVLSAQTEFPSYYLEDLTSKMNNFTEEWEKLGVRFDGIITGFVTGKEQIDNIFLFLEKFHRNKTLLLVDPVMGSSSGEVYSIYTDHLLTQMKELVKQADVITPNMTEFCLLTGLSREKLNRYQNESDYLRAVEDAGKALHEQIQAQVIITGVNPPSPTGDRMIGNMYINGETTFYHESPYNGKRYSGTGDLFASVLMGGLLRGDSLEHSIQLAQNFLFKSIQAAEKEHTPEIEGIHFEKYLRLLL